MFSVSKLLPHASGPNYRPDIDGLRALAVTSVLLFHAGLPGVSGGFVGVDIFFVISGYLITQILAREIAQRNFSVAQFYERRVRRIFPALGFTLFVTIVGSSALYSRADFAMVLETTGWLSLFASNFYFARNSGYFDPAADQNPFLQTWSLAIEEQFYVVFPIFLLLITRNWPRRVVPIVAVISVISLIFSIAAVEIDVRTAFFFTPGRVWELMLGGLLALGLVQSAGNASVRELVAGLGALACLGSIIVLTNETPFPGYSALPACLGAAAIIWAGSHGSTMVGWALSRRPVVFVGLISYSLYLLHWPLITFAKYAAKRELHSLEALAIIVISVGLATVSWRFVELPFRQRGSGLHRKQILNGAVAFIAVICGGAFAASRIIADRLSADEKVIVAAQTQAKEDPCIVRDGQTLSDWPMHHCSLPGSGPVQFIWGDSYAAHYFSVFEEEARRAGTPIVLIAGASCPPIEGYDTVRPKFCGRFNRDVAKKVRSIKPATLILSAHWMVNEKTRTGDSLLAPKTKLLEDMFLSLQKQGISVIVLGPSPIFPAPVPRLAASDGGSSKDAAAKANFSRHFDRFFRDLEKRGLISYFPVFPVFCDVEMFCHYRKNGELLFRDDGHLTLTGAKLVHDRFRESRREK